MKLTTGKYARFADGCSVASMGDTAVMMTVVSKPKASSSLSFIPLVVDYREKAAAFGRIPTNYFRRERGVTEKEVLVSRLIDRSIRPLFPMGYYHETQLMSNLLSVDAVNFPDVLGINAASTTLALSDIPWNGPVAAVRLGLIDNEIIVFPTRKELQESKLNLVVTSTKQNLVVMLEGHAEDILQQDLLKAIKVGVKEGQEILKEVQQLQKLVGKPKRIAECPGNSDQINSYTDAVRTFSEIRLREVFRDYKHDKISRDNAINDVRSNTTEKLKSTFGEYFDASLCAEAFNLICKETFRNLIFEDNVR